MSVQELLQILSESLFPILSLLFHQFDILCCHFSKNHGSLFSGGGIVLLLFGGILGVGNIVSGGVVSVTLLSVLGGSGSSVVGSKNLEKINEN
jgi:hypothetical protein